MKVPHDPALDELVGLEGLAAAHRVALDVRDGLESMPEAFPRVSQSDTASRKTRSRMLGLSPRAEMMST